jgi:hypothetical protein
MKKRKSCKKELKICCQEASNRLKINFSLNDIDARKGRKKKTFNFYLLKARKIKVFPPPMRFSGKMAHAL